LILLLAGTIGDHPSHTCSKIFDSSELKRSWRVGISKIDGIGLALSQPFDILTTGNGYRMTRQCFAAVEGFSGLLTDHAGAVLNGLAVVLCH
jgi:hypothetical protein